MRRDVGENPIGSVVAPEEEGLEGGGLVGGGGIKGVGEGIGDGRSVGSFAGVCERFNLHVGNSPTFVDGVGEVVSAGFDCCLREGVGNDEMDVVSGVHGKEFRALGQGYP